MIAQIRALLNAYQIQGGQYWEEIIANCGHSPHIEQPEAVWRLIGE